MIHEIQPETVNKNFFDHLVHLAASQEVRASEDVFASNGLKLISKGTPFDATLYDRMAIHKLRKPLETSIEVDQPVTVKNIAEQAEEILDTRASMRALCGNRNGNRNSSRQITLLENLRTLPLSAQAESLLSVYCAKNQHLLPHLTQVTLISMSMVSKLQSLSPSFTQMIATAGIFHDIGDLYLDPELFQPGKELSPPQWKQVTAHPAIGQKVLQKIDGIHPSVAKFIMEHHERLDGFGYPRHIRSEQISAGGQVLSVAETISGLMSKSTLPLRHAEIALKIVPGEFAKNLINFISMAMEESGENSAEIQAESHDKGEMQTKVHDLFLQIAQVLTVYDFLQNAVRNFSDAAQHLLQQTMERFAAIQKAFASTGLDTTGGDKAPHLLDFRKTNSLLLRFEMQFVLDEIQWRLHELGRELAARCSTLPDTEGQTMLMLVAVLNNQRDKALLDPAGKMAPRPNPS